MKVSYPMFDDGLTTFLLLLPSVGSVKFEFNMSISVFMLNILVVFSGVIFWLICSLLSRWLFLSLSKTKNPEVSKVILTGPYYIHWNLYSTSDITHRNWIISFKYQFHFSFYIYRFIVCFRLLKVFSQKLMFVAADLFPLKYMVISRIHDSSILSFLHSSLYLYSHLSMQAGKPWLWSQQ